MRIFSVLLATACIFLIFAGDSTQPAAGDSSSNQSTFGLYPEEFIQGLKRLRPNSDSPKINLTIDLKPSQDGEGKDFRAIFSTDRDCRLRLFTTCKGAQHLMLLFPNKWHESTKVQGGRECKVPGKYSRLRMTLTSPRNDGIIFAIAWTETVQVLEARKTVEVGRKPFLLFGAFKIFLEPNRYLRDLLDQLKQRHGWGYAEVTGLPRPDNIETTPAMGTTNSGDGPSKNLGRQ